MPKIDQNEISTLQAVILVTAVAIIGTNVSKFIAKKITQKLEKREIKDATA